MGLGTPKKKKTPTLIESGGTRKKGLSAEKEVMDIAGTISVLAVARGGALQPAFKKIKGENENDREWNAEPAFQTAHERESDRTRWDKKRRKIADRVRNRAIFESVGRRQFVDR